VIFRVYVYLPEGSGAMYCRFSENYSNNMFVPFGWG
jgi:hypothetical protein